MRTILALLRRLLDPLPFSRARVRHVRVAVLRRIVADAGLVALVAIGILGGVLGVAEFLIPGFAAHYVAPQSLGLAALLGAGLALCGEGDAERGVVHGTAYALLGAAATFVAFAVSWYYFASVPGLAAWVPFAAGAATGLIFFLSYPGRE